MTDLIKDWQAAKLAEQIAISARRAIEHQILKEQNDNIVSQLNSDYGCGSAKLQSDNGNLTLSYPKKVEWDNEKLAELWDKIKAAGDVPEQYIDRKLSINETKYNALPSNISDVFEPARTVSVGNPTFTFKEKK